MRECADCGKEFEPRKVIGGFQSLVPDPNQTLCDGCDGSKIERVEGGNGGKQAEPSASLDWFSKFRNAFPWFTRYGTRGYDL